MLTVQTAGAIEAPFERETRVHFVMRADSVAGLALMSGTVIECHCPVLEKATEVYRVGYSRKLAARLVGLAVAVAVVAAVAVGCGGDAPSATRERRPPTSVRGTATSQTATRELPAGLDGVVVSVTDGDTIKVRLADGTIEKVRLIGIDTPETKDPRTVVECFGAEASAETHSLLPSGIAVRLETDVERRDRYGRLLAYVWRVDDRLFVNAALIEGGWAAPYRYPPNVKYADEFSRLGTAAREANAGLWGSCGGTNTPAGASASAPAGGCDPNYSGACVPISSTDLDCGDIAAHGFRVVGTDIHRLDGNHDGIACE